MDKQAAVVFRNVGQLYFPQTRVECHYSVTPQHQWSSSDWIGIFQVGWSSVKEYYTYTWALVPENYTEGSNVNCCVLFQAFYLPRPSDVEYQFVYVDQAGEVRAQSRPFTFCAPKPLDELETLKEERDEEDGEGEELLLVVPRAQLLQNRLEESLKERSRLQEALDTSRKEMQEEKDKSQRAEEEWDRERASMQEEICELRDNLRHNTEMLRNVEGKHKDVKYSEESLNCQLSKILAEKTESRQQIRDLEEEVKVLMDRETEGHMELERLKERVKKMTNQMKHDEDKRKALQTENEAALAEVRCLQERLDVSEHAAESMRRELRELGTRHSHLHTELHQARLQVAQLSLHLSEENLVLREERANWALEREASKVAAEADKNKLQELSSEIQRKEEWLQEERIERDKVEIELGRERDCTRVQLNDAKREVQEVKAALRKIQKEREEQEQEKQELLSSIRHLEQRLRLLSKEDAATSSSPDSSSEDDEASTSASSRSVCSPLFMSSHLERSDEESHDHSSEDTQDEPEATEGQEKQLNRPQLVRPVLSELLDFPMW